MTFPFGTTITVLRDSPGGLDDYNNPVTSTTTSTDIVGCAVAPSGSTEPAALGRNGLVVDLTVFVPAGSDILFTDRIKIAGVVYSIDGDPADWSNPFTGTVFPTELALQRAVG